MQFVPHVFFYALGLIVVAQAYFEEDELQAVSEFCAQPQNQVLCQKMIKMTELALQQPPNYKQKMDKRKPSFVRFGKRSSPDAEDVLASEANEAGASGIVEKRKPSFVRFGRK
ncbi:unnamed protein product [Caenorhabditis auriculariae]|uniref:Uncharacterized protein n=1 Tax=Caenorhabditis auriculariae TaxID=2777116 RepID=A0A8S1H4N6_9PELO|nr:unnamed protein product [Caenorhabditis auriculariae]